MHATPPLPEQSQAGQARVVGAPALALLIVDDEVHLAGELADAAIDEGYTVHVAASAAAALEAIARHKDIGVMISDIRMPDCDGLQLTRQVLAARGDADAIEVILITGHATLDDAISAVRTGAFDFVRKPFRLREIMDATSHALARSIGRRRVAEVETRLMHHGPAQTQVSNIASDAADASLRSVAMLQGLIHELRTPLVPILGFAELLEMPQSAADTREFALNIGTGAKLLLTTVENLITLSLIERGQVSPVKRPLDAPALLRAMVEENAKDAEAAGVSLLVCTMPGPVAMGDAILLRRAMDILLRVALQRAARGGAVTLSTQAGKGDRSLELQIAAADAAMIEDAQAIDASEVAMQMAPLSFHFAEAVARLHGGALLLTSSPKAAFSASFELPSE